MSTIQKLPEEVIALIAAGEVVERPASVVKELVENSLDAGARSIEVALREGGRERVVVEDDGAGMARDQALLALERHATSKLRSASDLDDIRTLGFRGEALPSIAAVSTLRIETRPADVAIGTQVVVDNGTLAVVEEVGCAQGTRVVVDGLFGQTPARRKFLRSAATETGRAHALVVDLALAHPQVRFRLESQGRTLLDAAPVQGEAAERQRVSALLGRDLLPVLFPFAGAEAGVEVRGLYAAPTHTRRDTRGYHFFLHGRAINDRALMHAVRRGYRSLLDPGRHPVLVLSLELAPGAVDVNVHPAKHEVRFRDKRAVLDAVAHALGAAVARTPWVGSGRTYLLPPQAPAEVRDRQGEVQAYHRERVRDALERFARRAGQTARDPGGETALEPGREGPAAPRAASPESAPAQDPLGTGFFSRLRVVGQLFDTYLVCAHDSALVLVDQHAAHERLTYERLLARRRAGRPAGQGLLLPVQLELEPQLLAAAEAHADEIAALGFDLEPFGGQTVSVRAVPVDLARAPVAPLVRDMLEELAEHGRQDAAEQAVERVCARLACHGSVRAGQALAPEEIRALLRDLDGVDLGAHCPHGRPVARELTRADIVRLFERSG